MSRARRTFSRTVLAGVSLLLGAISSGPVGAHPEAFAVLVELTRQIELTPDDPGLLVSRGRWLERVGALDQALADYDRAAGLAGSGDEYHPPQLDLSRTSDPSDLRCSKRSLELRTTVRRRQGQVSEFKTSSDSTA